MPAQAFWVGYKDSRPVFVYTKVSLQKKVTAPWDWKSNLRKGKLIQGLLHYTNLSE